jgi:hypothetical protein
MPALLDINVLLPLIYGAHVHHAAAASWLNNIQADGELILCRISQLGLLRLLNNSVVMGPDVQNGMEAWRTWDALLADDRFRFADEPEGFETQFRILSGTFVHQPRRWQDASLAAFALAADLELVTFDNGFRSFPGLRRCILAPDAPPK